MAQRSKKRIEISSQQLVSEAKNSARGSSPGWQSCQADSCSEPLLKGLRPQAPALELGLGPGNQLMTSPGLLGKCPVCSHGRAESQRLTALIMGSIPDTLCDPERINYLLCAFISPIVNRALAWLTCILAGNWAAPKLES